METPPPGMLDALWLAAFSFGLMAVISLVAAGLIRLVVASLARRAPKPAPPPEIAVPVRDDRAAVAAAIAAAVHVALPRHRIVHIGEAPPQDWTREARATLHGSHRPRR